MALKRCRECGQDVSTEAVTCPHCGVPDPTAGDVDPTLDPDAPPFELFSSTTDQFMAECPACERVFSVAMGRANRVVDGFEVVGGLVCPACGHKAVRVEAQPVSESTPVEPSFVRALARVVLVIVVLGVVAYAIFVRFSGSNANEDQGQIPQGEAWVTADVLNRRTCPDPKCGIVGTLRYRGHVDIYEEQNGWVRTSRYYPAPCASGKNEYVESGNAACTPGNGVIDGRVAEWASASFLSRQRPADPAEGATGYRALVGGSDDYRTYAEAFAKAAEALITSGRCTRTDFEEVGGWFKSTVNHPNQPVYFTYCGGWTLQNRLYLNAETGEVFK